MIERKSGLAFASVLGVIAFAVFLSRSLFSVEKDETKRKEAPVVVELAADDGDQPSREAGAPQEPQEVGGNAVSPKVADDKYLLQERIVRLVGTEDNPIHTLYADAKSGLDRECVPLLRDMLKDPAYKNRWRAISNLIAWLGDSKDEASLNAILAYIRRPDLWKDADRVDGHGYVNVYGKAAAVGLLGFFELDSAASTLRRAFTEKGAEELIGTWVNMPHAVDDYSAVETIMDVRMHAASGLALSRDPENISLIEEQIEELAHWTWSHEYQESEDAEDVMESSLDGGIPYHSLADAMTRLDRIRDVGLEEFLRFDDTSEGFGMKMPYIHKYRGQRVSDGKRVLDPCPICGLTRESVTSQIE